MVDLRAVIPYRPYPQQWAIHKALQSYRRVVAVCHRQMGKTVASIQHLQREALSNPRPSPRYAYIAPFLKQAKQVAWDYLKEFSGQIPGVRVNESELRVDYPNSGRVRLFGADNTDALRGLVLDGVVCDEFGMWPADAFSLVVGPTLVTRGGWALFVGTPNGKNQLWEYAQKARSESDWKYLCFRASETGILTPQKLEKERGERTADEYAQEYECSFEASVKGAIYAKEIAAARDDGRIGAAPYDPALPVDTTWDLGIGDSTAIWFSQSLRSGQVRLVDYYESSGEGLQHYARILAERGYAYGTHWAPFDIEVKELGTGRSRLETAQELGIRFRIVPKLSLEDGIHAARMLFPRCWFDAEKCADGLEALMTYRRDYSKSLEEFTAHPVHDWASHGADAFRYLAVRYELPKGKPLQINARDYDEDDPLWRKSAAWQRSGRKTWERGGFAGPRGGA